MPDFEGWEPDYSEDSIKQLGRWFQLFIGVECETGGGAKEKRGDGNRGEAGHGLSTTLPETAVPIIADIGIYLGECVRLSKAGLVWERRGGNSKNMDYNSPVIMTSSGVGFNALATARAVAARVQSGEKDADAFWEVFCVWRDIAQRN